jgi:hypothetical protein
MIIKRPFGAISLAAGRLERGAPGMRPLTPKLNDPPGFAPLLLIDFHVVQFFPAGYVVEPPKQNSVTGGGKLTGGNFRYDL